MEAKQVGGSTAEPTCWRGIGPVLPGRSTREQVRFYGVRGLWAILTRPATFSAPEPTPSRASSLLQVITDPVGIHSRKRHRAISSPKQAGFQAAELLILILGAPSNHAGRKPTLIRRANRHGCRFSRTGPGMALCGGPPNQCRITGMPSLGEGPSGGARPFWLLLGLFAKSDPL